MKNAIKILENKWGTFEKDITFSKQCELDNDYLNICFNSLPLQNYKYIEDLLEWKIPDDLKNFYRNYNGLSFFSASVRIYGAYGQPKAAYNTLEIVNQNTICKIKKTNKEFLNYIVFGSYGYYYFCYKRNINNAVYVIGAREKKIVHIFNNIDELLEYYVTRLINKYDERGIKIHKEQDFIDTPMENASFEFI